MIIKSHVRGNLLEAAYYLKDKGANETTRLVDINDPAAADLDEAFYNMWAITCNSKVTKPLHHISINPYKEERLSDEQALKILRHCEKKYGYRSGCHLYVIVEHVKDSRQHFHVMWNRICLANGKSIWPGHHWKKSKQAAREMEAELGLRRPVPRRVKRILAAVLHSGRKSRYLGRYKDIEEPSAPHTLKLHRHYTSLSRRVGYLPRRLKIKTNSAVNPHGSDKKPKPEKELADLIAWAWENHRADILADCGINVDLEP